LQTHHTQEVTLSVQAELRFLPVATWFVEKSAIAFGMEEPEALSLMLATEELFAYLCRVNASGHLLMRCRSGGYYVEQEFVFHADYFNMKAFNITTVPDLDEQGGIDETGLLIASRMVDRFQLFEEDGGLRLVLTKEKAYPESAEIVIPLAMPLKEFVVKVPGPEELKFFVHLVNHHYAPQVVPLSFNFPGKVADMAACGACCAAIAVDVAGRIGGGIVWRWEGSKLVEFYGPYLFNQSRESGMAEALVDRCLSATARTKAIGLINRYPTAELPIEYFEPLGSLTSRMEDGSELAFSAYFRHLEEDLGSTVWAHSLIENFLVDQYRRLFFAREIRQVRDEGESGSPFSVLSAEFDRSAGRVTLHPIWWGKDSRETLSAYVDTLRNEGLAGIFFEMDVGTSWQCRFAPALLQTGFEPRLVIPHAGTGDIVVFQHTTGKSVP